MTCVIMFDQRKLLYLVWSLFAFFVLVLSFQHFTCLHIACRFKDWQCSAAWSQFPIKNL